MAGDLGSMLELCSGHRCRDELAEGESDFLPQDSGLVLLEVRQEPFWAPD